MFFIFHLFQLAFSVLYEKLFPPSTMADRSYDGTSFSEKVNFSDVTQINIALDAHGIVQSNSIKLEEAIADISSLPFDFSLIGIIILSF